MRSLEAAALGLAIVVMCFGVVALALAIALLARGVDRRE